MEDPELEKIFKEMEKDAKGDKKLKKKEDVAKLAGKAEKQIDKLAKDHKDVDV